MDHTRDTILSPIFTVDFFLPQRVIDQIANLDWFAVPVNSTIIWARGTVKYAVITNAPRTKPFAAPTNGQIIAVRKKKPFAEVIRANDEACFAFLAHRFFVSVLLCQLQGAAEPPGHQQS